MDYVPVMIQLAATLFVVIVVLKALAIGILAIGNAMDNAKPGAFMLWSVVLGIPLLVWIASSQAWVQASLH